MDRVSLSFYQTLRTSRLIAAVLIARHTSGKLAELMQQGDR